MAMMAQNFYNVGSRGSSTGSSKNYNCYPKKRSNIKGFRALGSRGSSISNFSAEKKKVEYKKQKREIKIIICGYEIKNTATHCYPYAPKH